MSVKKRIKTAADIAMLMLLPLLMTYSLIGKCLHEWLGVAMLLIFMLHHILNLSWHKTIFKGKYNALRVIGAVTDILLLIVMLVLMCSGIVMSGYVFSFLHINFGQQSARLLHLIASYWGFVLMGFHTGMHWNMMISRFQAYSKTPMRIPSIISRISVILISLYGLYRFIGYGIIDYMFLKTQFVFYDFSKSTLLYIIDYTAMTVMFGCIGYFTGKAV